MCASCYNTSTLLSLKETVYEKRLWSIMAIQRDRIIIFLYYDFIHAQHEHDFHFKYVHIIVLKKAELAHFEPSIKDILNVSRLCV